MTGSAAAGVAEGAGGSGAAAGLDDAAGGAGEAAGAAAEPAAAAGGPAWANAVPCMRTQLASADSPPQAARDNLDQFMSIDSLVLSRWTNGYPRAAESPRRQTPPIFNLRTRATFWLWDHPGLSPTAIGRAVEQEPMAADNPGKTVAFLLGHPPTATVGAAFIKSMQIGERRS
jgi:hypothetical protein